MKNKLIVSLMLPLMINYTTNALPTKTPHVGGAIVLATGLTAAVGIKTMYEHDQSNNIALGVALTSLVGTVVVYRYLKPLTTEAKLEKVRNILQTTLDYTQKNKEIWHITTEDDKELLEKNIRNKYAKEDYPVITFFKTDINYVLSRTEEADKLIESELKELEEQKSYRLKLFSKLLNPLTDGLTQELKNKKEDFNELSKELKKITAIIRTFDNFDYHLEAYNKNLDRKTQTPLIEEQTRYYKNQNSYLNNFLMNNPFVGQLLNLLLTIFSSYMYPTGQMTPEN